MNAKTVSGKTPLDWTTIPPLEKPKNAEILRAAGGKLDKTSPDRPRLVSPRSPVHPTPSTATPRPRETRASPLAIVSVGRVVERNSPLMHVKTPLRRAGLKIGAFHALLKNKNHGTRIRVHFQQFPMFPR